MMVPATTSATAARTPVFEITARARKATGNPMNEADASERDPGAERPGATALRAAPLLDAVLNLRDRANGRPDGLGNESETDGGEHHGQEDHDCERLRPGPIDVCAAGMRHQLDDGAIADRNVVRTLKVADVSTKAARAAHR